MVSYVPMADGVTYIEKATLVNSTLTSITGADYTIGGNVYKIATLTGASAAPTLTGQAANFYVDSNGYIVYHNTTTPVVVDTYGVVTDSAYTAASAINGTTASSKVLMTTADGTTAVYNVVNAQGQPDANIETTFSFDGAGDPDAYLVKYVMNASGVITSINAVSGSVTSGTIGVGGVTNTTLDSKYVTSATQYFYVASGASGITVSVYEGYANAPAASINASTNTISYAVNTNVATVLDAVMVYSNAAATSQTVAYIVNATPTETLETINGTPTPVYSYSAYVDGAATTIKTDATGKGVVTSNGVNIYDITTNSSTGLASLAVASKAQTNASVTVAEATYAVVGGIQYTVNANTKVFQVTKDATGKITNIAAATLVATTATQTVTADVIASSGTATNIFFTVS